MDTYLFKSGIWFESAHLFWPNTRWQQLILLSHFPKADSRSQACLNLNIFHINICGAIKCSYFYVINKIWCVHTSLSRPWFTVSIPQTNVDILMIECLKVRRWIQVFLDCQFFLLIVNILSNGITKRPDNDFPILYFGGKQLKMFYS